MKERKLISKKEREAGGGSLHEPQGCVFM